VFHKRAACKRLACTSFCRLLDGVVRTVTFAYLIYWWISCLVSYGFSSVRYFTRSIFYTGLTVLHILNQRGWSWWNRATWKQAVLRSVCACVFGRAACMLDKANSRVRRRNRRCVTLSDTDPATLTWSVQSHGKARSDHHVVVGVSPLRSQSTSAVVPSTRK